MPTYEYQCQDCGHAIEVMQKITEDPLKQCPKCHKEALRRGPGGGMGLVFQGSGFYVTDYASPSSAPSAPSQPQGGGGQCGCGKTKGHCH